MQHGGWAAVAATAHHHLAARAVLMAAWHDDAQDSPGIGTLERLRALLSEWWRRAFRAGASR